MVTVTSVSLKSTPLVALLPASVNVRVVALLAVLLRLTSKVLAVPSTTVSPVMLLTVGALSLSVIWAVPVTVPFAPVPLSV